MANSKIISTLKNRIIKEIINDEEIVKAIDSPDMSSPNWEPIYLLNTKETEKAGFTPHIYREMQVKSVINKTNTFLTISVQIPTTYDRNKTWVSPTLEIMIISHNEHTRIDNIQGCQDNRVDYLSMLLDKKFNSSGGYGSMQLSSNYEGVYDESFIYRKLTFEGIDINNSLCREN